MVEENSKSKKKGVRNSEHLKDGLQSELGGQDNRWGKGVIKIERWPPSLRDSFASRAIKAARLDEFNYGRAESEDG